ncbi:MAG: hypothetical protein LDLANPLL_02013 [Turneriella sp.]|nr:hypothetical protein [Turneriella sp.]
MSFYLSALMLGVFSQGHCLGMCGPLVLALPVNEKSRTLSIFYRVLYNIGRITTYATLGLLVGLLGVLVSLAGVQAYISYIVGSTLILVALLQLMPFLRVHLFFSLHTRISQSLRSFWERTGASKFFLMGAVNGLLPCGMVSSALIASLAAASALQSMLFMLLFGLGTVPMMLAASLFGVYLSPRTRKVLAIMGPLFSIALGVYLLLRPSLFGTYAHTHIARLELTGLAARSSPVACSRNISRLCWLHGGRKANGRSR